MKTESGSSKLPVHWWH